MRTEVFYSSSEDHPGYGAGSGDTERIEYMSLWKGQSCGGT